MLSELQQFVFMPVTVLAATAVVAGLVTMVTEWRARAPAASPTSPTFRPVLVHDRGRQMLLRSTIRGGGSRAGRPNIRLVYNGG